MAEYTDKECKRHGLVNHRREKDRWRCVQCATVYKTTRRHKIKNELIVEMGGKCSNCGYDRCIRALEFHHVDPTLKGFTISRFWDAMSIGQLREEAQKCILLCSNCHAEEEERISAGSANGRLRDSESRHVGSNPALAA